MEEAGKFLKDWGPLIFIVAQFFMNALLIKMSGRFATKKQVEDHDTRIGNVEGKVQLLEKEIENMPTSNDLCELKETLAKVGEALKNNKETNKKFERAITRIENYLMEKTD